LDALRKWVLDVRQGLTEAGRARVADWMIGEVLSRSPGGSDEVWPHEAIRSIIEELHSDELEQAVASGVLAERGFVTKGLYEGGRQERELATHYTGHADSLTSRWPRTAAMLREIANTYARYAVREDQRAKLDEEADS
jgi:hypothetical protein